MSDGASDLARLRPAPSRLDERDAAPASRERRAQRRHAGAPCRRARGRGDSGGSRRDRLPSRREKALAVSRLRPGRLVLGADQTLACDGQAFHKPADRAAAREQLIALSGRTHVLHSAFALAEAGTLIHTGVDEARMTVRALDGEAIDSYLRHAGDAALRQRRRLPGGRARHSSVRAHRGRPLDRSRPPFDPALWRPCVSAGCLHSDRASDEVHRDRASALRTSLEPNLRIEKPWMENKG